VQRVAQRVTPLALSYTRAEKQGCQLSFSVLFAFDGGQKLNRVATTAAGLLFLLLSDDPEALAPQLV
jgi:hypothetical protein